MTAARLRRLTTAGLRALCQDVLHTGAVRFERVGTSNGCRSFKVTAGDRTVKCYECLSPERARAVRLLSAALRDQGIPMPRCLGTRAHVVIAEWVDGRPFDGAGRGAVETMAAYQARLHEAIVPPSVPRRDSMPHLEWLFSRLLHHGRRLIGETTIADLRDRLMAARPAGAPRGILHPDFITTNLVVTVDGSPISVDNEFLTAGYGQEWDVLNTLKVSFPDHAAMQRRYLEAYAARRNVHTLISHREYWEACYDVKMAGKRLREGKVDEGVAHVQSLIRRAW